jgi:FtsZ-interacting cell division protein ZipA
MDQRVIVAIVIIVALIVLAAILVSLTRKRRSRQLKEHFGPEYDRLLQQRRDPARAEAELIDREKRVHRFSIKPLPADARNRYAEEWASVQRQFVDDPMIAVTNADALVNRVMSARGYPMADFEQRAADVSVNYPAVVQNYRSARTIMQRHSRGEAGTEDLRQAMVHYRALFAELLDIPKTAAA